MLIPYRCRKYNWVTSYAKLMLVKAASYFSLCMVTNNIQLLVAVRCQFHDISDQRKKHENELVQDKSAAVKTATFNAKQQNGSNEVVREIESRSHYSLSLQTNKKTYGSTR